MHLALCNACERVYDATALFPGELVRCSCGASFDVPVHAPRQVEALACGACGGSVTAADDDCPWCGAGLDALDRARGTICPRCYARVTDDARHCGGCALPIRPQRLTPLPPDRACPACRASLVHRPLPTGDAIECRRCAGVWLSNRSFGEVCRGASELIDAGVALDAEPFDRAESSAGAPLATGVPADPSGRPAYLGCLECAEPMHRLNFRFGGRKSGIIVDACREHGLWLDAGELAGVARFVAERRLHGAAALLPGEARADDELVFGKRTRTRSIDVAVGPPQRGEVSFGGFLRGVADALSVLLG